MDPRTKAELFQMYKSYKHELWEYTGNNYEDSLKDWFEEMLTDRFVTVQPVRNAHTNSLIGFFATQALNREQQEKSGCQWYISESYILPSYRNQGSMTAVVHEFALHHQGNIGLTIVNGNYKAEKFWTHIFKMLGYEYEKEPCDWDDTASFYKFTHRLTGEQYL